MNAYAKRNELLRGMGFPCYADYLASDLWKGIRDRGFAKKGRCCRGCLGYATILHHRDYHKGVLEGRDLGPLLPVCEPCHKAIEFTPEGVKRTFEEARKVCGTLLNRTLKSRRRYASKKSKKAGK